MKVGVTLPQFREDAETALRAARRAESLGLDGVFCFDHLWPLGHPGRPVLALWPLLGAVAASTSTIRLGSLVARIGLLDDRVLVREACALQRLSGGRFVAGLGTGDHLSRSENGAFGVPFPPAADRRARLHAVATELGEHGVPVWVGGAKPLMVEVAASTGAAVNVWEGVAGAVGAGTGAGSVGTGTVAGSTGTGTVAALVASGHEVTWGGPVGAGVREVADRLAEVAASGAAWAVCAWPDSLETVAEAASSLAAAT